MVGGVAYLHQLGREPATQRVVRDNRGEMGPIWETPGRDGGEVFAEDMADRITATVIHAPCDRTLPQDEGTAVVAKERKGPGELGEVGPKESGGVFEVRLGAVQIFQTCFVDDDAADESKHDVDHAGDSGGGSKDVEATVHGVALTLAVPICPEAVAGCIDEIKFSVTQMGEEVVYGSGNDDVVVAEEPEIGATGHFESGDEVGVGAYIHRVAVVMKAEALLYKRGNDSGSGVGRGIV